MHVRVRMSVVLAALLATSVWWGLSCGTSRSNAAPDGGPVATDAPSDSAASLDSATHDSAPDVAAEAGPCGNLPAVTLVSHTKPPLVIAGDPGAPADAGPSLGFYDPSIVYPTSAPGGVMSYSAVSPNDVHTRIAVTTDHGQTFTYAADVNEATATTVTTTDTSVCGSTTCPVVLWHEVSSLVADPSDPDPNAAFKVFVHTYASLANGTNLRRDWGYIGLATAPQPSGPWSTEKPLLGWASSAAISTNGVAQVLTATPALADCVAFTEPGAIVTPLGVDVALTCVSFKTGTASNRVVLLRSVDHAATFSYVSTLLTATDASCLASPVSMVNGPDLFVAGGTEYLVVTPIGPITPSGNDYSGCVTVPIADAAAGQVERTVGGAPNVVRWLASDDHRFTGPCTYAEGATASGYFVPMLSQPPPPMFHVVTSGIAAP